MNVILSSAQLMIIAIICIYEYRIKSSSIFMWVTCLVMFGLTHFILVLSGFNKYPSWVLDNASLFVIGFCLIYFFVRSILQKNNQAVHVDTGAIELLFTKTTYNPVDKRFVRLMFALLTIAVSYNIIFLVSASGGVENTSWASSYNNYVAQDYISFSKVMGWIYYFCSPIFFVGLCIKDKKLYITSGAIIILYSIITRSRYDLIPLLSAVIALFIFKKEKLIGKKILLYVLLGSFTVYIVYALRVFRHYGTIGYFISTFSFNDFNTRIIDQFISGNGELGLLEVFYHFIYYDNNFPDFGQAHTYLRMLFVLIPTKFSFGLKPSDFGISMGSAWLNNFGNTNFSTHPTLFGDSFANLGYFGIFLGAIWAIIVFWLDKIINHKNTLVKLALLNLICYNYVLIGRGSVYNSFATVVYGFIFIGCIFFVSRLKY